MQILYKVQVYISTAMVVINQSPIWIDEWAISLYRDFNLTISIVHY